MSRCTSKSTVLRSRWASDPEPTDHRATQQRKISKERREPWDKLNQYISEHGGSVISAPYDPNVRLAVAVDSPLPAELIELGYQVHHHSREMRTGCYVRRGRKGTTSVVDGIVEMDILDLTMPG